MPSLLFPVLDKIAIPLSTEDMFPVNSGSGLPSKRTSRGSRARMRTRYSGSSAHGFSAKTISLRRGQQVLRKPTYSTSVTRFARKSALRSFRSAANDSTSWIWLNPADNLLNKGKPNSPSRLLSPQCSTLSSLRELSPRPRCLRDPTLLPSSVRDCSAGKYVVTRVKLDCLGGSLSRSFFTEPRSGDPVIFVWDWKKADVTVSLEEEEMGNLRGILVACGPKGRFRRRLLE